MAIPKNTFDVPYKDPVQDISGLLTTSWEWFFRSLWERLYPLGIERSFDIANNVSGATDITGMKFSSNGVSQVHIDFLVQRVTTGGSAVELIESGFFIISYKPTSQTWAITLVEINHPSNSGVDFTVTADGQIQYTSTNEAGTASISKLYWRARTIGGKNQQYSVVGKR